MLKKQGSESGVVTTRWHRHVETCPMDHVYYKNALLAPSDLT